MASSERLGGRRTNRIVVLQPGQDRRGILKEVGLTIMDYADLRWEQHRIRQVVSAQLLFCLGKLCPFLLYFGGEVWKYCDMYIAKRDIASLVCEA